MKNRIIYLSFLVSLAVFSSCKKQLELLPSDVILPDQALRTVTDLEKGLFGVYASNGAAGNRVYIGTILADESLIANTNRGQGQFTFKWQYSGSPEAEHNADYANCYGMIDNANKILGVIDAIPTANATEVALKKRIKAELTALRGIELFECLIRFMPNGYSASALGVPIVLKSELYGKPARNTVGEVITQVNTDLAAGRAETGIPNAPVDVVRLSQATIAAYQARVSLLTRDWAGVVTHAKEAITLSGKDLATGTDFEDYWTDDNEIETLWKYRNQATPQLLWTDANGDIFFSPANKLMNEYDAANDVRFSTYFNSDEIIKYPGSASGPQINDIKLVRVAELYLDLAEAYAQLNDLTNSALYLNGLRAARIDGYTDVTLTDQQDGVDQALDERYKELCYEGFRFFDLKRNALPINRDASDVQSPTWQNLSANDHRFALPIPQHEIFANKNMKQNPGY